MIKLRFIIEGDLEMWRELCRQAATEKDGRKFGFIDILFLPEGRNIGICRDIFIRKKTGYTMSRRIFRLIKKHFIITVGFPCKVDDMDVWVKRGYGPCRVIMSRLI